MTSLRRRADRRPHNHFSLPGVASTLRVAPYIELRLPHKRRQAQRVRRHAQRARHERRGFVLPLAQALPARGILRGRHLHRLRLRKPRALRNPALALRKPAQQLLPLEAARVANRRASPPAHVQGSVRATRQLRLVGRGGAEARSHEPEAHFWARLLNGEGEDDPLEDDPSVCNLLDLTANLPHLGGCSSLSSLSPLTGGFFDMVSGRDRSFRMGVRKLLLWRVSDAERVGSSRLLVEEARKQEGSKGRLLEEEELNFLRGLARSGSSHSRLLPALESAE
eukprot:675834-Prorocentrum_minimum.AAC.2